MPKKIDDELNARAVRLVQDHRGEYASLTAAAAVVAKQLAVGKESVRRWVLQAEKDGGQRAGASSEEPAEIIGTADNLGRFNLQMWATSMCASRSLTKSVVGLAVLRVRKGNDGSCLLVDFVSPTNLAMRALR